MAGRPLHPLAQPYHPPDSVLGFMLEQLAATSPVLAVLVVRLFTLFTGKTRSGSRGTVAMSAYMTRRSDAPHPARPRQTRR